LTLLKHLMSIACKADARECFRGARQQPAAFSCMSAMASTNRTSADYYPAVGGREDAVVMACTLVD
jgi:ribosomal-protein-alanine N-acetyltransferase